MITLMKKLFHILYILKTSDTCSVKHNDLNMQSYLVEHAIDEQICYHLKMNISGFSINDKYLK